MVSTLKELPMKLGCSTQLGLLMTKPTIDTQLDLSLQNLWLWKQLELIFSPITDVLIKTTFFFLECKWGGHGTDLEVGQHRESDVPQRGTCAEEEV